MNRCLEEEATTTQLSVSAVGRPRRPRRRMPGPTVPVTDEQDRGTAQEVEEVNCTIVGTSRCYEITEELNMLERRSGTRPELWEEQQLEDSEDESETRSGNRQCVSWGRRRTGRGRRRPSIPFLSEDNKFTSLALLFTVVLSLALSTVVAADTMWDHCEPCSCKWSSGKKAAECMGKKLKEVPKHLSSDLQVIDLSQNEIPEIRKQEFANANLQNVHKLFMRNCTIQYVHRDAMRGLNILIELDMSNNLLTELPVGFFHPMERLRTLVLNNNQIAVIEDGSFKDMRHLHKIELKNNQIHTIGVTAFSNLPLLAQIYLDMNRLRNLKKASFDNLDKLTSLSILQNPWNCTCDLEEFKEFVVNRNLYMQPTCFDPPALKDKSWGDLTEKFACRPRVLRIRPSERFWSASTNETLECEIYGSPRPEIYWLFNKKPLNSYDNRYKVRAVESYTRNGADVFITKLTIVSTKPQDKGTYTCVASNSGGKDERNIYMERSAGGGGIVSGDATRAIFGNIYVLIVLIFFIILVVFAMVVLTLLCCRRKSLCSKMVGNKKYKNGNKSTMSERGLIQSKLNDKGQNDSIIEGGSVIMEMQKSLLTEVNPVEKPPRRTEVDANGSYHDGLDDKNDIKKTLLDETAFGSHDDETQSVALSDATPRSRQTFVDDGYGTSLPPDLLAFSNRYGGGGGAGPVLAMTASTPGRGGVGGAGSVQNLPMNAGDTGSMIYGQSPLGSPIYSGGGGGQGVPAQGIYGTIGHNPHKQGFRTLPHQRYGSSTLLPGSRLNPSPLPGGRSFTPGPIIYQPAALMKQQGYVTIPRKPRTPSWAPSVSSTNTNTTHLDSLQRTGRMTPTSPTSMASSTTLDRDHVEPVYDNLGMRTTASGNSVLNVNKVGRNYTMKDRPLPATPGQQTPVGGGGGTVVVSPTEPLYDYNKPKKVPPLPPPKPQKKKMSVMSNGSGANVSQLYQDEGDDGTEV